MKKKSKKLRLSRETLQILQGPDTQKVVGVVGADTGSCQSGKFWCFSLGDDPTNDTCDCGLC